MSPDPSTINGNRQRGTGILNNELYIGRQVWNRVSYVKDPKTGKRVPKINPESDWVVADVPELRIVDQDLWDKVRGYQGTLDRREGYGRKRRPTHLLSYLLKCGECGGGMSLISKSHYGCSTARNKGTCNNRTAIGKDFLEEKVLGALRSRLMDSELTEIFCHEYAAHMNRLRTEQNAQIKRNRAELEKVERDMAKMLQAVMDGLSVKYAQEQLEKMQARKDELEQALEAKEEVPVFVHPSMAERYAKAIQSLLRSFNDPNHRDEAAKTIRTLVEEIVLTPNADRSELVADMKGDLAAILSLAGASTAQASARTLDQMSETERKEIERAKAVIAASEAASGANKAPEQVSMVAGEGTNRFLPTKPQQGSVVAGVGFEPTTFRL